MRDFCSFEWTGVLEFLVRLLGFAPGCGVFGSGGFRLGLLFVGVSPASVGIPRSGVGHLGFVCSRPLTLCEEGKGVQCWHLGQW